MLGGSQIVEPQARRGGAHRAALGRAGQERLELVRLLLGPRPIESLGIGQRLVGRVEVTFGQRIAGRAAQFRDARIGADELGEVAPRGPGTRGPWRAAGLR